MKCPFCNTIDSKVVDSRAADEGASIRRRRECLSCQKRFTTYEQVDEVPLMVVKKDGRRERWDRRKLFAGLLRSCEKRPIEVAIIEKVTEEIEKEVRNKTEGEIEATFIGDLVLKYLYNLDKVAYIRFSSVYKQFTDIHKFMEELQNIVRYENMKAREKNT